MTKTGSGYDVGEDRSRLRELERTLERKNSAFEALFRLFEKLGSTFDADVIIRLFLMTLAGQIGLERIAFYVIGERGGFELYHSIGMAASKAPRRFGAESAFTGWIRRSASPAPIGDFFTGAGAGEDPGLQQAVERGGLRYACILGGPAGPVGCILLGGKISGDGFTVFDVELLRMITQVAAITLRNAFLYQEAVRAKADAEAFAKVKREFISHTSHELRTPLTVIKSSLWSLDAEEPGNTVLIDMARDAVTRMQDKVEQILSLNEMDLSGRSFDLQPVDVSAIVEDICREMIPEFEEREITVRVEDRAGNREAPIDASKMKIALRALVDNAIASVERGGFIEISMRVCDEPPGAGDGIEIATQSPPPAASGDPSPGGSAHAVVLRPHPRGPWLVLRIRDDGRGIPPGEIGEICEPFRRASNSAVSQVRGLGLGLSVSQRIIAGHGGRLFCRSEVGSGAEFSVWLPL
ncbi:MAG: ATP-binding protein [Candidatus Krumholzibacteria bacterium]|nr:ATP-binding protein [Candidatus Krumholzibacteria bacterium]